MWQGQRSGLGLLGIRSGRNPSSGIAADHEGAAPSQAAQLLLLHCFTAGLGGGNVVVVFFFFIIIFSLFLTDLLTPSCKGSCRHSGEGE